MVGALSGEAGRRLGAPAVAALGRQESSAHLEAVVYTEGLGDWSKTEYNAVRVLPVGIAEWQQAGHNLASGPTERKISTGVTIDRAGNVRVASR